MKDIRFQISLYVIIPIIFAGIALISIIGSHNLTDYFFKRNIEPQRAVMIFGTIMALITFGLGLIIAKLLLGPVERFVRKTEELGILAQIETIPEKSKAHTDDMGRFNVILETVTELLSKVDSQKLFPQIVGQSRPIRSVLNQIVKVAGTDATVLIVGETGTGKELISESIHEHSQRASRPFVALNCAAIPDSLLESELFGHEKGAFTGADSRKLGKFETADGGTVFLDEIGDMPLETQAKLLRVLQESKFERVGGIHSIEVDVRFIAATNKDLSRMVEEGAFRQDLFYRLNVFTIQLPPLRNRQEDIPALVSEFLQRLGKEDLQPSPETIQILSSYTWPGNVRELQNVVEAASVMAGSAIEPVHLPVHLNQDWNGPEIPLTDASPGKNLDDHLRELEKRMILDALKQCNGVQVKAAKMLGIKERSLWHRIKKLDIDITSLKAGLT
ncbi:Response regulator of zinc sigma-54-dependent two-component system [Olavius algarvensis associated proteobacterium Delta 3]|nr:Response regulator of zinc sigma-54-dependent two-component system [Olavius algarvensis associated proteobacterium Delta 3]